MKLCTTSINATIRGRFLSLARSKLRLCSANHTAEHNLSLFRARDRNRAQVPRLEALMMLLCQQFPGRQRRIRLPQIRVTWLYMCISCMWYLKADFQWWYFTLDFIRHIHLRKSWYRTKFLNRQQACLIPHHKRLLQVCTGFHLKRSSFDYWPTLADEDSDW